MCWLHWRGEGWGRVTIAAELRTGSAFYYSGKEAGSWRFGKMDLTQVPISHAVAASAAHPLFLPALDEFMTFRKRDGSLSTERVTLTAGGIYDNLGLSPLWPDRDRAVSIAVEEVDTIVACKAGYGLRMGRPSTFIFARMFAAFDCVSNTAQNGSVTRLFDLKAAGIPIIMSS
jgi:NTE family protein